ncbi:winged helix-turn-helix domain-containing protein [Streptomyces venezuelae]|uniref:ArsR/SmtB family transcription factor n=1 Tax=Streptomyces venezuelae TaxID=54571 RepID=UPI003456D643
MNSEELLAFLSAVGHAQRIRIITELAPGQLYVSELARRLGVSRPLLYMHLERLEKAGLVVGRLELSDDGKALKYFELAPFDVRLNVDTILAAVRQDAADASRTQDEADQQSPEGS